MELLGVPINLSKSVVAKNSTVEFAKVTTHNGVDVSALSVKLFLASSRSLMGRVNMVDFFLRKGIGLTHLSRYITGVLRLGKYTVGSMAAGYLGLMTMLINKKVITLSKLIGFVNDPKNPLKS